MIKRPLITIAGSLLAAGAGTSLAQLPTRTRIG